MAAITRLIPVAPLNWYASNPDIPPGGLGVQLCASGVSCNNSSFNFVVTSSTVGGDDGDFYFPYILDPNSTTAMLVGTCRVWRGARAGGAFTALSPNFDTLGSGTCAGSEVNQVRALAAAGSTDSNGSSVIYATTSGLGPLDGPSSTPAGGRVWVTTDATAGHFCFRRRHQQRPARQHQSESVSRVRRRNRFLGYHRPYRLCDRDGIYRGRRTRMEDDQCRRELDRLHRRIFRTHRSMQ